MPEPFDYKAQPLGSLPGEAHLRIAYNQVPVNCVVRVRNLSGEHKRKIIIEAVSLRRGGERSIMEGPYRAQKNMSVDALRFRASQGENMNWVGEQVLATDFVIRHNNVRYLVPHTDAKTGEKAPWVTVEPGVWDLYQGNWERMHSDDLRERTDEVQRLNLRGFAKWTIEDEAGYGFLEFNREEIRINTMDIDNQIVASGAIIEV